MNYNYNFALGSVLFMSLTLVFYLRQNRMKDQQDRLYTLMLFGGLTAVVFDFIAAALEPSAAALPLWSLYAVNYLFLLGEQICLPAFFMYSVSAAGLSRRLQGALRVLPLLPFFLILLLMAASPFGDWGIFYIDAEHIYCAGAAHWLLYAVSLLYMLGSCAVLAANYRRIDRRKRFFIFFFVAFVLCAIAFQMRHPRYLLTTSATALALTAMYYALRAPGEQEDPFTGALCRPVLPELLKNYYDEKRPFTLLLYTVLNYNELLRAYGPQLSDGLLAALADWLKGGGHGDSVVFMNDADYVLVSNGELSQEQLHTRRQQAPATLVVEGSELPVKLAMAALLCHADDPLEQSLTAMDFLFRKLREEQREDVFVADDEFRRRCGRLGMLEASMDRISREGKAVLLAQSVRSLSGTPAMLDLSLGLLHEELRDISADDLLMAIQQSGNVAWYYKNLVSLAGERARHTGDGVRFCLPLLPGFLIQDDMATRLFDLVDAAGMEPRRIVLRFQEEDAAVELPVIRDNIRRLAAFGYGFRLDGFAEGYTDMSLLGTLPLDMVMLDKSLIKYAVSSQRGQDLLVSVVGILRDSGKEIVCDGVDSPEEAQAAKAAGAALCRGDWCE